MIDGRHESVPHDYVLHNSIPLLRSISNCILDCDPYDTQIAPSFSCFIFFKSYLIRFEAGMTISRDSMDKRLDNEPSIIWDYIMEMKNKTLVYSPAVEHACTSATCNYIKFIFLSIACSASGCHILPVCRRCVFNLRDTLTWDRWQSPSLGSRTVTGSLYASGGFMTNYFVFANHRRISLRAIKIVGQIDRGIRWSSESILQRRTGILPGDRFIQF